jgi:ubiquinone/menaquinone biosynthesis C-methylase UbiE
LPDRRIGGKAPFDGSEQRKGERRRWTDRRSLIFFVAQKIGQHWDTQSEKKTLRTRWWQSTAIISHINKNVCGRDVPGLSNGLLELVRRTYGHRFPLNRGISVGSGTGAKEMRLIEQGIVEKMDLYEVSQEMINRGISLAKEQGLSDTVSFIRGDGLQLAARPEAYDLVYWNSSLHHILDVEQAVAWSYSVLKKGGLFLMDEYVGPSRFQWTDEVLKMATKARRSLPERMLANPASGNRKIPRKVKRPKIKDMIREDPSEAADSSNIIPSVRKHFPQARIIMTGGVIYQLVFKDVLQNINEEDEEDRSILEHLLQMDDSCIQRRLTHFAVAIAEKQ